MSGGALPLKAQMESLLGWWTLAGVDSPVGGMPVNWMRPRQAVPRSNPVPSSSTGFPDSLQAFHDFLAHADHLPEASWPGVRVMPCGPHKPRIMILAHAPDQGANTTGAPFDGPGMALLRRMLGSVGLDLADCYIASLSVLALPGGMADGAIVYPLVERMRHHIGLVEPTSLLILGDQASRAMAPTGGGDVAKNLPFVNHSRGIVPAAAIAHPRLLLGQAMAKAGAWQALRELVKGWGQ